MQADWKIVERGWHAHVLGEAKHKSKSALEAIKKLRVRRQPMKFFSRQNLLYQPMRLFIQGGQGMSQFGRSSTAVRLAHDFPSLQMNSHYGPRWKVFLKKMKVNWEGVSSVKSCAGS